MAAEVFEESLNPFLPKILTTLQKKLKEATANMHTAISDTLGHIVLHIVDKIEDEDEKVEMLQTCLRVPFGLLEKSPNKVVQAGASLTLSKAIQSSPEDVLSGILGDIIDRLLSCITSV